MISMINHQRSKANKLRLMIDGDIIHEIMLNRHGFIEEIEDFLFKLLQGELVNCHITSRAIDQISLEQKDQNLIEEFRNLIIDNLNIKIIDINSKIKEKARYISLQDYNSAIEYICALEYKLDAIITQNPTNFYRINSVIPIWTIGDLCKAYIDKSFNLTSFENSILSDPKISPKHWFTALKSLENWANEFSSNENRDVYFFPKLENFDSVLDNEDIKIFHSYYGTILDFQKYKSEEND